MTKVTIIGSGIAAIAAAIEAEAAGAEVILILGQPGATALSSGAWDIAGCPTRYSQMPWHNFPSPKENLYEIVKRYPHHPYTTLSKNSFCSSVDQWIEKAFETISHQLNLKLRGSASKNLFVVNPLGGVKLTAFVPHSHWSNDWSSLHQAHLLLIGFRGLPSFSPHQAAILLRLLHDRQPHAYFEKISSSLLDIKDPPFSPVDLASRCDDETNIEEILSSLVHEAKRQNATHVVLPPVLGIKKPDHILSRLKEETGLPWFETLGVIPSLPGLRLQGSIDFFLEKKKSKWTLIEGRAKKVMTQNRRIQEIQMFQGEKEERLPVDRLILATGRYLGGGLLKEKIFEEPLLDLPLFIGEHPAREVFIGKVTGDSFFGNHPLFSIGVRTNENLQPLGERDPVLYENLWVAGSLLGGYHAATQHCGMGVAVGTGTLAGRMASL